jgi:hypothetical protein
MLIAHGPISIFSCWLLFRKQIEKKTKNSRLLLFFFFFLAGILPDFDFFFLIFRWNRSVQHHELFTHTPIFWILLSILFYFLLVLFSKNKILKNTLRKENVQLLTISFFISTLSHIFFDFLTGYILLLYPFSTHAYTILGNILPSNIFSGYLFNPLLAVEILMIGSFTSIAILMSKMKRKLLLVLPLLILPILYLVFNVYLYNNNYHLASKLDNNGMPIVDLDKDGLLNQDDADIDNNGINNFVQADSSKIAKNAKKILDSNLKIYSPNSTAILDKLNVLYGGLTIKRLIFQAYWEEGNLLEPVIWDFGANNKISSFNTATLEFFKKNLTNKKAPKDGNLILIHWDNGKYSLGLYIDKDNVVYEDINGNPKTDKYENILKLKMFTEN